MDDEFKHLLRENIKISQDALSILKKLDRARKLRMFFQFIKWSIIIGLFIFGFIKLQPYLATLMNTMDNISKTLQQINSIDLNRYLQR